MSTHKQIKTRIRRALNDAKKSIEPVLSEPIKANKQAVTDLETFFIALKELTLLGLDIKNELEESNQKIGKGEEFVVSHLNELSNLLLLRYNDYVFMLQPEELALTLKEIKLECLKKTFNVLDSKTREKVIEALGD